MRELRRGKRSCASYGCMTGVIAILAIAVWIASKFVIWKHCEISLPDGSGSVVYMAKLNKIPSAEWDRKVRIETNRFHGRDRWIPEDPSGAWPVSVYWYAARNGSGPYLRFHDPVWEYLIDIKHGTTLLVLRNGGVGVRAGEISSPYFRRGYVWGSAGGEGVETVDGHPVRKLEGYVASSSGVYIGRVEYPFNRFVSKKEAPEAPLPEH